MRSIIALAAVLGATALAPRPALKTRRPGLKTRRVDVAAPAKQGDLEGDAKVGSAGFRQLVGLRGAARRRANRATRAQESRRVLGARRGRAQRARLAQK